MLLIENRLFAQISHFFIDNATVNKKEIDTSVVPHSSGHFITKMESYLYLGVHLDMNQNPIVLQFPWKRKSTPKISLQIRTQHVELCIHAKFQIDIFFYVEKVFSGGIPLLVAF